MAIQAVVARRIRSNSCSFSLEFEGVCVVLRSLVFGAQRQLGSVVAH